MVGRSADGPVAKILTEAGFEVDAVATEQEARASLDRKAWTLVFVAQTIGKASLQSLIVHAGQKRADLPVIVLGAAATLQEAVDAMQLGAADFIAPPFEAELMLSRLKRLVSESASAEPQPVGVPTLEHLGLTGSEMRLWRCSRILPMRGAMTFCMSTKKTTNVIASQSSCDA